VDNPDQKIATVQAAFIATAAWLELEACIKQAEAGSLRQDNHQIEHARERAHALLDTHIDMKIAAHSALRRSAAD
jgi:hypothetical protein